jgi:PTS system cellobiose-specific IIC component
VRDGVVAALPLVLIGSVFLLLGSFLDALPADWKSDRLKGLIAASYLPVRMLSGAITLYVTFGTARSLARHFTLDELGVPLMALASFLVAVGPAALKETGWGLPGERIGPGGLFGAFVVALGSVHVQRQAIVRRWTIRMPGSVPEVISKSFASIIPGFLSVAVVWALVHGLGLDLVGGLAELARPLIQAGDSLPFVVLLVLVDSVLWLLGVHPLAIMAAVKPMWLQMITANSDAVAAGLPPPHLAPREFFLWFVWQGGSGTALALALLLLRAKSAQLKTVGRIGFVPALFNVNEPLLFGAPVVMNPRLAIPFVVSPVLLATTAWLALHAGLVRAPSKGVLWTLPAPIGAWLDTGDWRAVILQMTNLGLAVLVWWPFVRSYDRSLVASEAAAEAAKSAPTDAAPVRDGMR